MNLLYDLIALLAGVSLTLSFAPFGIYPLAVLAPALLLLTWLNASPKRAFWRGFLFGLGLFLSGVYWVFISINTFGNTTLAISIGLTSAMIGYLALYPAFNGYLLNRFFPNNNSAKLLFAFPALWIFLEWCRSWIITGFPWLFLGYSQINSPLKGYAPILGVYGVSLAVVLSSSLIVVLGWDLYKKSYKTLTYHLLALVGIWLVGGALSLISWTQPTNNSVKVSLVQGNIPQHLKWTPDQILPTLNRYMDLTRPHWDSQLIIWPESAIPLPWNLAKDFTDQLTQEAQKHHTTVITGIPIKATQEKGYYNGIIALGNGEGVYTKQRLVPFGEYIPFRDWFGKIMELMQVPMSDFIPGEKSKTPLIVNGIKIAAFVCYEIAYPELVLSHDRNIGLILAISNDGWFGKSIAQAQHAEIAQMRAVEMGRPVLFVGNDGITAVINAKGKIQSRVPQFETTVLTDDVLTTTGKTLWQTVGMYPIYILIFVFLAVAYRRRKYVN